MRTPPPGPTSSPRPGGADMPKVSVSTPCPNCDRQGAVITSKDYLKRDGDKCVWPCGYAEVLMRGEWVVSRRCPRKQVERKPADA
jgi:hypothetical protein